ncbi:SDR family NAD(P)-dependent oxidoreductase [Thiohalorhabdus methylotrophus]|uniref:SDR family NAD(P)-dependent oxidoreductase n=1 Tax=Thiohalorhabdus methylotrophus TaxID=3242694 RepID=A0ABV4TQG4_9GAMM
MEIDLSGKTAIVSGSTAGIGFAVAEGLADSGARVVVTGRTQSRVDAALSALREHRPEAAATGVAADLATTEGVRALTEAEPRADILVNNLGMFGFKPFEEYSDEEWQQYFEVNVMSGVRLTRAYLGGMTEAGWGRVVFVSSESALHIPEDMIPYAMTKTAQLSIARGLAERVRGTGVTVNSVLPGPTLSESLREFFERQAGETGESVEEVGREFVREKRPDSLIGRPLDVAEVASMIVYACSPQASGTSGAPLRVEGGLIRSIA